MTTFNQLFILLAVILVVIRTTYANFDYCIGVNSVSPAREVVGFQLWNDRGEEAAQYRSLSWAHKTIMYNSDWFLYIDFTPLPINPESISVFSSVYGEIGPVPFELACGIGNFNGTAETCGKS
ncbi:hypothetical protein BGZ49_009193 [Haplosporangium sp. Z 27]|nr:hypothetical protein BGZ49_009193 [Haplosporangium sp. Z 27]